MYILSCSSCHRGCAICFLIPVFLGLMIFILGQDCGQCSKRQLHHVLIIEGGHNRSSTSGEPCSRNVKAFCEWNTLVTTHKRDIHKSGRSDRHEGSRWCSQLILSKNLVDLAWISNWDCASEVSSSEGCWIRWCAATQCRNASIRSYQIESVETFVCSRKRGLRRTMHCANVVLINSNMQKIYLSILSYSTLWQSNWLF